MAMPSDSAPPDARSTVFLPAKTDFEMEAGLPQLEPTLLVRWEKMDLYRRLREASRRDARNSCCTTARPTPTAICTSVTRSTRF